MKKTIRVLSVMLAILFLSSKLLMAETVLTTPLVIGSDAFDGTFCPFYSQSNADKDIVDLTQLRLLTIDRNGGVILNAIEGETVTHDGVPYDYTGIADWDISIEGDETVYKITIRDDLLFSDGQLITADDIVFSYYVVLDPAYKGSSMVDMVPIKGLQDYRSQAWSAIQQDYRQRYRAIIDQGSQHVWSETDAWTKEQHDFVWTTLNRNWERGLVDLVDYIVSQYPSYAPMIGLTPDELAESPELHPMFAMTLWGFGQLVEREIEDETQAKESDREQEMVGFVCITEDGQLFEWTFELDGYPTVDDFLDVTKAAYANDPVAFLLANLEGIIDPAYSYLEEAFIYTFGSVNSPFGPDGVTHIEGVRKTGEFQVEVVTHGYDTSDIYLLDIPVTPLHYYGENDKYDYDKNQFGLEYKNQDRILSLSEHPLGAGPYVFDRYEEGVVYMRANQHYYRGEPEIAWLEFKETEPDNRVSEVINGAIDMTIPPPSDDTLATIMSINDSNGLNGNILSTVFVDDPGYGYIGLNAGHVLVGEKEDDAGSQASRNLRKGFATIFAALREQVVDFSFGQYARVIEYPISDPSWVAPDRTDSAYRRAFSLGIDGDELYSKNATTDEKLDVALDAARAYFVAAGYTYDEESEMFTDAPGGARLVYDFIIPAGGTGDHPLYELIQQAKEALQTIGFDLIIIDPVNPEVLWQKLNSGQHDMWTAAWGGSIDPDLHQVYHSTNIAGQNNSSQLNYYHIQDSHLDELIVAAHRTSERLEQRSLYKDSLDIVMDWAVTIPVYQRRHLVLYSTERIDMASVMSDMTTHMDWMAGIERLELITDQP